MDNIFIEEKCNAWIQENMKKKIRVRDRPSHSLPNRRKQQYELNWKIKIQYNFT